MAMWIIIRDGKGRDAVRLVYHNLIQDRQYPLGSCSSDWDDDSVLQWIFDNAENLTPGDFIKMSNGRMLHWDGRAFALNAHHSIDSWCRMRAGRACT
jgi:hypothetical protein